MQIHNLISEYNDHAFLGPHSIEVGPFTSNFVDMQRISTLLTQEHSLKHPFKAKWAVFLLFEVTIKN